MNWLPTFWTQLETAIAQCWPEVTTIFRETQANKRNWVNLVNAGQLVAPWVVIELPHPQRQTGWALNGIIYKPTPTVYYIAADTGSSINAYLEGKLTDFEEWLFSHALPFTVLTEDLAIDVSETNPVNQQLLEAGMPFTAGGYTFSCLTGYVR